jgi:hypothetical protein
MMAQILGFVVDQPQHLVVLRALPDVSKKGTATVGVLALRQLHPLSYGQVTRFLL